MTPARGRETVDFVRTAFRVSVRRACRAVPAPRSTYHYRSRRPEQAFLRKRIRGIAETRVRHGYRRIWAMDWMYDQLFDGRRIWVLAVLDTWSRVCPVLWVCRTATAWEVTSALDRAVGRFGAPKVIRVDQGRQFTSRELDLWAYGHGVTLDFSRPGKPTDNAYIESFNARVRAECLNQSWFLDLDDARRKVEDWRVEYNEVRPHSAIGDRPPIALLCQALGPPEASPGAGILT